MEQEKISFVYPTLVREGMFAGGIYTPDLSMTIDNKEQKNLIAVTAGFAMKSVGMYAIEVEINEESAPLPTEHSLSGHIQTNYLERTKDGGQIAIFTMLSDNADLSNNGFYRVVVRLYKTSNGEKIGNRLDEKDCFFYVSHKD
ncbi:hypothetical protein [Pantoea stewartii]|uniref:hypothetical protein n=1 Tax=Pantoea stewartii TaxID=66269 RepID=UPI001623E8B5|nr:hypothetical protein [Pantoea stewartii]MBC0853854.1 hypothetical protein [Pantoea stewartii]